MGASLNSRIVFAWANGNGGKFKRFLTEDLSLFSMGIAEVDFLCKVLFIINVLMKELVR